MVTIRKATLKDLDAIRLLFKDTITTVACKDYSEKEIEVWSSSWDDIPRWEKKLQQQAFYVAVMNKKIVGFTSILNENYIDHLYVSSKHQGQGIASRLLAHAENVAINNDASMVRSDVSITARPFFESKGYRVTKQNTIHHKGEVLINFDVIKEFN